MHTYIKDINFLPDYVTGKKVRAQRSINRFFIVALIAMLVGFLVYAPKMVMNYYTQRHTAVQRQLSELNDIQKKLDQLDVMQKKKTDKDTYLREINKNKRSVIEMFDIVQGATPQNVEINRYSLTDKGITIAFTVGSPIEILDFIDNLEELDMFEDISVNTFPIVDKTESINFSLQFK